MPSVPAIEAVRAIGFLVSVQASSTDGIVKRKERCKIIENKNSLPPSEIKLWT